MTTRVEQAEAQLREAKAADAAEQRKADALKLAEVREAIGTARAEYNKLRQKIRQGEEAIARVQATVDAIVDQITLSMLTRPEAADFLPDDPEVQVWQQEHDALVAKRDCAIERREQVRASMPTRVDCVKYEGVNGIIANLERLETNLLRKLRGEPIDATWQGGVYRVL